VDKKNTSLHRNKVLEHNIFEGTSTFVASPDSSEEMHVSKHYNTRSVYIIKDQILIDFFAYTNTHTKKKL
jgi:hypothetical protein